MASDFLSLVLQAAGGGIADTANTKSMSQVGADIMVAGLVLQAISLVVFLAVAGDFAYRCYRRSSELDVDSRKVRARNRPLFKVFLAALLGETIVILIRSCFRAAELWTGFGGSLWNDEVSFMVLDGAMVAIATILLTVFHPGWVFGGLWIETNWTFKKQNKFGQTGGARSANSDEHEMIKG